MTLRAPILLAIPAAILLLSLGMPGLARALPDTDGDLVPDVADNCLTTANGPNQTSNQVDADADGYGNRCDTDYDQSGTTTVADFAEFLGCFTGIGPVDCPEMDHDGSGTINVADFAVFLGKFSAPPGPPGPSSLSCALSSPCRAYSRDSISPAPALTNDTIGIPNDVASSSDYDVVTFQVPGGNPGEIRSLTMVAGAPGGLCTNGAQCYADGTYLLAGWTDLAEALANPTTGTLFHLDVTELVTVDESFGSTNDGVEGAPRFPTSLLTIEPPSGSGADCPATGCVVALLSDVSAAPGLIVDTRATRLTFGVLPDRALCPVGCEGGLEVGPAGIGLVVVP